MSIGASDIARWAALDTLDHGQIVAMQVEALRKQVRRLETNPFFRARFLAAGVSSDSIRSIDDIRRFPTMNKADVLADNTQAPPFGTRLGVDPKDIREIATSGGTSGNPPEVYGFTGADLDYATDLYAMDQYWKGARTGDIAMMVSHISLLTSPSFNVRAWERIGMPVLKVGANSTEERMVTYARFRPNVLKLPYAYALRFMHAMRVAGIDPRAQGGLKYVFISGGAYPAEFAAGVEDFFGAPMHEVFGCSQAGTVTSGTCEHGVRHGDQRGVMHCYDHAFVTEVLDPLSGEHVKAGNEGELVLTHLWRHASPVFRYRMGDRVRYLGIGQCRCGRQLKAIECGTIARYDDMIRIKGVNLWAHDLDAHILSHPGVDEFNGVVMLDQEGKEHAVVRVELHHGDPQRVREALAVSLKAAFHVIMDVEIVPTGTVQRFDLKQKRWTDERGRSMAMAGH